MPISVACILGARNKKVDLDSTYSLFTDPASNLPATRVVLSLSGGPSYIYHLARWYLLLTIEAKATLFSFYSASSSTITEQTRQMLFLDFEP